jgi:hypothetical protein
MMPGGHLATSVVLAASGYAWTHSIELTAGCLAGGFLIDVDHYLDYLFVEKQWRRPWPTSFLSYYFRAQPRRLVLPLHSYELMLVLAVTAMALRNHFLSGYLLGAALHLILDITVNGEHGLRRPVLFYLFAYRASRRFVARELLDARTNPGAAEHPLRDFFKWRPLTERVRSSKRAGS